MSIRSQKKSRKQRRLNRRNKAMIAMPVFPIQSEAEANNFTTDSKYGLDSKALVDNTTDSKSNRLLAPGTYWQTNCVSQIALCIQCRKSSHMWTIVDKWDSRISICDPCFRSYQNVPGYELRILSYGYGFDADDLGTLDEQDEFDAEMQREMAAVAALYRGQATNA
jgi:hypothetical protein